MNAEERELGKRALEIKYYALLRPCTAEEISILRQGLARGGDLSVIVLAYAYCSRITPITASAEPTIIECLSRSEKSQSIPNQWALDALLEALVAVARDLFARCLPQIETLPGLLGDSRGEPAD